MTKVLVCDDSAFVCKTLSVYLEQEPDLRVCGRAHNPQDAAAQAAALRPDVATIDLEMPGGSGLETLQLLRRLGIPVVVVSGASHDPQAVAQRAHELGAADFVAKFIPGAPTAPGQFRRDLVAKVRAAAAPPAPARQAQPVAALAQVEGLVIAVAASTGGPLAFRELLAALPADFPGTFVVVQHLAMMRTSVYADQLRRGMEREVFEAAEGDALRPGAVHVAPADRHLLFNADGLLHLVEGPRIGGHRPSADVLLQSAAETFGPRACGLALSGAGADGAMGLSAILEAGGLAMAQAPESCVIDALPLQALARCPGAFAGTPQELAARLAGIAAPIPAFA